MGKKVAFVGLGDVVAEGLGEELIGRGEVLLAVPEQHKGTVVERGSGRLGHQRGLTETRLARHEQHVAPLAPGDTLDGVGYRCRLRLAADHSYGWANGQTMSWGDPDVASALPSAVQAIERTLAE